MTPKAIHFIFCLLLFNYYSITALNTIDCTDNEVCNSSRVSCDPSDDCYIICNGANVCDQKTFICPTDTDRQCFIECIGNSCLYTTFDASNSLNGQLKLSIISTSNGNDENVWSYGSLICPPGGDCTIISRNDNIQHNHINALNAKSLNITIFAESIHSNVLYESDIYCPIKDAMYCDINIYEGLLSNVNIYTTQHQFLWIICKSSNNCYDEEQQATLYCGTQYKSQCNIVSKNTLTHCICYGSSNSNDPQTTTPTINQNMTRSQTITATNLRYVIVTLSAIIVLSLITICCCGLNAKIKHNHKLETNDRASLSPIASESCLKYDKNTETQTRLSINKDSKYIQSDTSLMSPHSMQSGASSVQYTVNNLFGKEKYDPIMTMPRGVIPKQQPLQPPIPPIAALPPIQVGGSSIPGFGRAWTVNTSSQYFGTPISYNSYSYHNNNNSNDIAMSQPGLHIQRSAPILIPGAAPYHDRTHSSQSESESNLMALTYNIVDGDGGISTVNHAVDVADNEDTDNTDSSASSASTASDGGEVANDTHELFMQLKRARYGKARKSHTYHKSVSKSQDVSMGTMVIKETDECEYRFGHYNNEVRTPQTMINVDEDIDDNKRDCVLYKEGQHQNEYTTYMNHDTNDDETTEYSFTENTNSSHSNNTNDEEFDEKDKNEEGENAHNMMSVIYDSADDL